MKLHLFPSCYSVACCWLLNRLRESLRSRWNLFLTNSTILLLPEFIPSFSEFFANIFLPHWDFLKEPGSSLFRNTGHRFSVTSHLSNGRFAAQSLRSLCSPRHGHLFVFVFKHLCYSKPLIREEEGNGLLWRTLQQAETGCDVAETAGTKCPAAVVCIFAVSPIVSYWTIANHGHDLSIKTGSGGSSENKKLWEVFCPLLPNPPSSNPLGN